MIVDDWPIAVPPVSWPAETLDSHVGGVGAPVM